MNIAIPNDLAETLSSVAGRLHKPKKTVAIHALKIYLEDQEDYLDAVAAHDEWVKGGKITYSLEEVMKKCGIDEKDLDA